MHFLLELTMIGFVHDFSACDTNPSLHNDEDLMAEAMVYNVPMRQTLYKMR